MLICISAPLKFMTNTTVPLLIVICDKYMKRLFFKWNVFKKDFVRSKMLYEKVAMRKFAKFKRKQLHRIILS